MKTRVEMLFEIYQEVCKEAGLQWTLEGWKFFDQVMIPDYFKHCKMTNNTPNMKKFKKNCIEIAKEMKEQAK